MFLIIHAIKRIHPHRQNQHKNIIRLIWMLYKFKSSGINRVAENARMTEAYILLKCFIYYYQINLSNFLKHYKISLNLHSVLKYILCKN